MAYNRTPAITQAHSVRLRLLCGCALGAALPLLPQPAKADGFNATFDTPTIFTPGGTVNIDRTVGGVDTITIGNTAPIAPAEVRAVINWNPTDTGTGGGEIDFLPSSHSVLYQNGGTVSNFTVLNRILPTDRSRPIRFDGTVTSRINGTPGGNIWFYSPGGIVASSSAVFDVGSLVLSALDIDTTNGLAFGGSTALTFKQADFANAAINIDGANLTASGAGSYLALVAPQIIQAGNVSVTGPIAYVAAEALEMRIDQGLFSMAFNAGTGVGDAIVHTGTTGGSAEGSGDRRAYFASVAKNDAITTLLIGGSIGYTPAMSAENINGTIVLSGGGDITDAGGPPSDFTSTGVTNVRIGGFGAGDGSASFSDFVSVNASGNVTVEPGAGGTVSFLGGADIESAGRSSLIVAERNRSIVSGGSVRIASRNATPDAGAIVEVVAEAGYGAPALIDIAGSLDVDGGLTVMTGDTLRMATASVLVDGGTLRVGNDLTIDTSDRDNDLDGVGRGGNSSFRFVNNGTLDVGSLNLRAGASSQSEDTMALGGDTILSIDNGNFTAGLVSLSSNATAANGGAGRGGNTTLNITGGNVSIGTILLSASVDVERGGVASARGVAGGSDFAPLAEPGPISPALQGGNATLNVSNVDLDLGGSIVITANADPSISGEGFGFGSAAGAGDIVGGTAAINVMSGSLTAAGSLSLEARSLGSGIDAAAATDFAVGGTARLTANGVPITAESIFLDASAFGSDGITVGGSAFGGTAIVETLNGGAITATGPFNRIDASGYGGGAPTGGNGSGGTVNIETNDGVITLPGDTSLTAFGVGGSARSNFFGGNGIVSGNGEGGTINVNLGSVGETGFTERFTAGTLRASVLGNLENGYGGFQPGGDGGDGRGGTININQLGGVSTIDTLLLSANGEGEGSFSNVDRAGAGGDGFGGAVNVNVTGGVARHRTIIASANARGGNAGSGPDGNMATLAGNATGGTVDVNVTSGLLLGESAQLSVFTAGGIGASDAALASGGAGGNASGGSATFNLSGTGELAFDGGVRPNYYVLLQSGGGGGAGGEATTGTGGTGGNGSGASLNLIHSTTVVGTAVPDVALLSASRGGDGGGADGGRGGLGGNGTGGNATVTISSANARLGSVSVTSGGLGGGGGEEAGYGTFALAGGAGGNGSGGAASLVINSDTTIDLLTLDASSSGGAGGTADSGGAGGSAINTGSASLTVNAGTLTVTGAFLATANASGGAGGGGNDGAGGRGGNAEAGRVDLLVAGPTAGLNVTALSGTTLNAFGTGGIGGASFSSTTAAGGAGGDGRGGALTATVTGGGGITFANSAIFAAGGQGGAGAAGSFSDVTGDGGRGGNAAGGRIALDGFGGLLTAAGLNLSAAAVGGVGGDAASFGSSNGRGGDGGDAAGGGVSVSGFDTVTPGATLLVDISSSGARGGSGGIGGIGGDGLADTGPGAGARLFFGQAPVDFDQVIVNANAFGAFGGFGGDVGVEARGGAASAGFAQVISSVDTTINNLSIQAQGFANGGDGAGGTARLEISGGTSAINTLSVVAGGTGGIGTNGASGNFPVNGEDGGAGGDGNGGLADILITGLATTLDVQTLTLQADATGGRGGDGGATGGEGLTSPGNGGNGGDALGDGLARLVVDNAAQLNVNGGGLVISATSTSGVGGAGGFGFFSGDGTPGRGGNTSGGTARLVLDGGGVVQATSIALDASGIGGETGYGNGGGVASGGNIDVQIASGQLLTGSVNLLAQGRGGNGVTGFSNGDGEDGGDAVGGRIVFNAGEATGVTGPILLDAQAFGGAGGESFGAVGGAGGSATSGSIDLTLIGQANALPVTLALEARGGAGGFGNNAGGRGGDVLRGATPSTISVSGEGIAPTLNILGASFGGNGGTGAEGAGGAGGNAAGPDIRLTAADAGTTVTSEGISFDLSATGGSGGAGGSLFAGAPGGAGGAGGSASGGSATIIVANDASYSLPGLTLLADGVGGLGGAGASGSAGGRGGDGTGGALQIDVFDNAILDGGDLSLSISGNGGAGGGGGAGANGANGENGGEVPFPLLDGENGGDGEDGRNGGAGGSGGAGTGGSFAIAGAAGSTIGFDSMSLTLVGTGGNAGAGQNGGDGGRGGFGSDANPGQPGGFGENGTDGGRGGNGGNGGNGGLGGDAGRAGSGSGGIVDIFAQDGAITIGSLSANADGLMGLAASAGVGGLGGAAGTGGSGGAGGEAGYGGLPGNPGPDGTAGLSGSDGLSGNPFCCEQNLGRGGTVTIEVERGNEFGRAASLIVGDTTISARADNFGEGGEVTIKATSRIDESPVMQFGALNIDTSSGFGGRIQLEAGDLSTIQVGGDANLLTSGELVARVTGSGGVAIAGNLTGRADFVNVSHDGRGADADTITANDIDIQAFGSIDAFSGARIRALGSSGIAMRSIFGPIYANDLRSAGSISLTALGEISVVDAEATGTAFSGPGGVSGGSIDLNAGFDSENFFDVDYFDATAEILGTVTASGAVTVRAGGDVQIRDGAQILSDNSVLLQSGDDIVVGTGTVIRSALNLAGDTGYGTYGSLELDAGVVGNVLNLEPDNVSSIVAGAAEFSAESESISLRGNAIQAGDASFSSQRFTATITEAPEFGVAGRDDDGLLTPACAEGNVCLGAITAPESISIGGGNIVSLSSGTVLSSNDIEISARDLLAIGDGTSLNGNDAVTLSTQGLFQLGSGGNVASQGTIDVDAGELLLDANAQIAAAGDVSITVTEAVSGDAVARIGSGALIIGENVSLYAQNGIDGVESGGFVSGGRVEARSTASLGTNGSIFLNDLSSQNSFNTIGSDGEIVNEGTLSVPGSVLIGNVFVGNGSANIDAGSVDVGSAFASNDINFSGGAVSLTSGSAGAINLNASGNVFGGDLDAGIQISLIGSDAQFTDLNTADGSIFVTATSGTVNGGTAQATGEIAISGFSGVTTGALSAGGSLSVTSETGSVTTGDLTGSGVTVASADLVTTGNINAPNGDITLTAVNGISTGDISAETGGVSLSNPSGTIGTGTIFAFEDFELATQSDVNIAGVNAGDDIRVTTSGNARFGRLIASGEGNDAEGDGANIALTIGGDATVDHAEAGNDFTASATNFSTGLNSIITGGDIVVVTAEDSDLGNSTAGGSITVDAGGNFLANSLTAGSNVFAVAGNGVSIGSIDAGEMLGITGATVTGTGTWNAGEDIYVETDGAATLASLTAGDDIDIIAGDIVLQSGTASGAGIDDRSISLERGYGTFFTINRFDFDGANIFLSSSGAATASALTADNNIDVFATGDVFAGVNIAGGGLFVNTDGAASLTDSRAGGSIAVFTGGDSSLGVMTTLGTDTGGEGGGTSDIIASAGGTANFVALDAFNSIDIDADASISGGSLTAGNNIFATAAGDATLGPVDAGEMLGVRGVTVTGTGAWSAGEDMLIIDRAPDFGTSETIRVQNLTAGDDVTATSVNSDVIVGDVITTGLGRDDRTLNFGVDFSIGGDTAPNGADINLTTTAVGGNVATGTLTSDDDVLLSSAAGITTGDVSAGGFVDLVANDGSIDAGDVTGSNVTINSAGTLQAGNILATSGDIGITTVGAITTGDLTAGDGNVFLANELGTITTGFITVDDDFTLTTGSDLDFAGVNAGGDILIDTSGNASLGVLTTLGTDTGGEGGGTSDIIINAGGAASFVAIDAFGSLGIEAGDAITGSNARAGGDATLAAGGPISINGLSVGGVVNAVGGSIDITNGLGPLDFVRADATAGGVFISTDESLVVRTSTAAAGDIVLVTGGALTTGDLSAEAGSISLINGAAPISLGTLLARDDFNLTTGGGLDFEGISVGDDIRITTAGDATLGTLATTGAGADAENDGGSVILSIGGALTASTIDAEGGLIANANGPIDLGFATAGGNARLNSATGAITVADLRAGGTVDARGTALAINGGADLAFSVANATSGDIALTTVSDLSVDSSAGARDTMLTSSNGAVSLGTNVDASRALAVRAAGSASVAGAALAATIDIRSANIAIANGAQLGAQGRTTGVILSNTANSVTTIGGSGVSNGYSLSNGELQRVFATDITINAPRVSATPANSGQVSTALNNRAPDVILDTLSLTGAGGQTGATAGNIGSSGRLRIITPGKLRTIGAVAISNLGSGNRFEINAAEAIEVDAATGSIALSGGSGLGGTLALTSQDVIAASSAAFAEVANAATIDVVDARLARNDGPVNDNGYLRADGIVVNVSNGFYVQNSGTAATQNLNSRRGLTVGSGGLSIVLPSQSSATLPRIVINGRQVATPTTDRPTNTSGFITGVNFLRVVRINNGSVSGGNLQTGLFDPGSTINGCAIVNVSQCSFSFGGSDDPTNIDRDIIQEIEEVLGEDPEGKATLRLPSMLIEIKETEELGYQPVIDDPVTGSGNDDLFAIDDGQTVDCPADQADCPRPAARSEPAPASTSTPETTPTP